MNDRSKRRVRFLAAFVGLFAAVWFLWDTPFVYPVKLFVVLLHEISHGLATLATGGRILAIEVTPREGGLCRCPGGNAFLSLSAGLDIKSDILDRPELRSDARMLAELTGVPTLLWGGLWIAVALLFCFVLFRWAWRRA